MDKKKQTMEVNGTETVGYQYSSKYLLSGSKE